MKYILQVFYSDKPLVVCAPTGAGKTAIFELAIVRLLMKMENHQKKSFKVVYSKTLVRCFILRNQIGSKESNQSI